MELQPSGWFLVSVHTQFFVEEFKRMGLCGLEPETSLYLRCFSIQCPP